MKIRPNLESRRTQRGATPEAGGNAANRRATATDGAAAPLPADTIDALTMRAELAARGLVDANRDGLISPGEIKPGGRALDVLTLRSAAGSDGVLDKSEVAGLRAPRKLKADRRKTRAILDSCHDAIADVRAAWPPTTDAALATALRDIRNLARELGPLDATELGLGTRVALSMVRDGLVELGRLMGTAIGPFAGLTLGTRHELDRLGDDMSTLARVARTLGAAAPSVDAFGPPRLAPARVSATLLNRARAAQASGDVAAAWRVLAAGGDAYAAEAANIVDKSGPPPTLFAQIVHAHWDRVVGAEVKAAAFDKVAAHQLENYLGTVERADGVLPNTEVIERCYRRAVEAEGLPPGLAIDSVISKIDLALDDSSLATRLGFQDVSWGSMLGLGADRIAFNSDAFADVDMKAGEAFLKTARHTLRTYPLDVKVSEAIGLMTQTVRALVAGEPPATAKRNAPPPAQVLQLTLVELEAARTELKSGNPEGAWMILHDAGDGYAHYALTPLAERDAPQSLLAQVVNAHWDRFLGQDGIKAHFLDVNVAFLEKYLTLAEQNDGRLPNTQEIEAAYRASVEGEGLDPILAPDSVMSRLAEDYDQTPISWAGLLGIAKERVVYRTGVFADLDIAPAKEMFKAQIHWIMQRHVHMPFSEMASMTWQRVRDFFD